jgi:O-antigen/teichoic acid export membrane protein
MRSYVGCYALYAFLLVLSYGVFVIWSQTILLALGVFVDQQEVTPALWGVGVLVLGTSLYLFVLVAEPYLRDGVPKRQLRARFLRIAGPLIATILVGVVAQELIRVLA